MIAVDTEVLAYAFAASLVSALLFGLAPAVRLARTRIGETLKEGARSIAGSPHQRTRRVLAAVQLALAFVLVVSSGLLLRSFLAMITANPGFQPHGAITASVELPTARYDAGASATFYARALERIRALHGIEDAAFTSDLPWTGYDENTGFSIVGRPSTEDDNTEASVQVPVSATCRSYVIVASAGTVACAAAPSRRSPPCRAVAGRAETVRCPADPSWVVTCTRYVPWRRYCVL